jgi:hypothetical protein
MATMFAEVPVFKKVQADDGCPKSLSIYKEDGSEVRRKRGLCCCNVARFPKSNIPYLCRRHPHFNFAQRRTYLSTRVLRAQFRWKWPTPFSNPCLNRSNCLRTPDKCPAWVSQAEKTKKQKTQWRVRNLVNRREVALEQDNNIILASHYHHPCIMSTNVMSRLVKCAENKATVCEIGILFFSTETADFAWKNKTVYC